MANPKHSGFEAPTVGVVHSKGSKIKRNKDGTISVVQPKSKSSKRGK